MRLVTWNCRTLGGVKLLALSSLIQDYQVDIAVVTEAELQPGDLPIVPGYTTHIPRVQVSTRVRLAIFCRAELQAEALPLGPSADDLPLAAIALPGGHVIAGLYRQFSLPGSSNRGAHFEEIQLDLAVTLLQDLLESTATRSLTLLGDLNLDLARANDPTYYRRQLLGQWQLATGRLGLHWLPTGPTFTSDWTHQDKSRHKATLDHVYVSAPEAAVAPAAILPDAATDHAPVLAVVQLGRTQRSSSRVTRTERDFHNMDKDILTMCLLDHDWAPLLECQDPETVVALLEEAIEEALTVAAPTRSYTTPNPQLRLQPDTRSVMRARNAAKARGSLNYKALRNRALALVRRDRVRCNLDRLRRGGQAALWALVAETRGKDKGKMLPLPSGCPSNKEAANRCNLHYIDKIDRLRDSMTSSAALAPSLPIAASFRDPFTFCAVGTAAVRAALKGMRSTPAKGLDGIPITVLKAGWSALALPLTHLTNVIIDSAAWPKQWKESRVIPDLKPGKRPADFSSYRPVSLLSSISKLVEGVLHRQLADYVEEEGLLPEDQHGFRRGKSVDTALATVTDRLAEVREGGKQAALVAFDFTAAFDTLDPALLIQKMPWLNTGAITLIKSYLSERSQRVAWNGTDSDSKPVRFGVPQGSVIGPLLFTILTSDLPSYLCEAVGPSAGTIQTCLYADDTSCVVTADSREAVSSCVTLTTSNLGEYSSINALSLNCAKTQELLLPPQPSTLSSTLLLLGVHLDGRQTFTHHHTLLLKDLAARVAVVRRLRTEISRGPLLRMAAWSLVVGKLQPAAWITRRVRLESGEPVPSEARETQVILNDLARVLLGVQRKDRLRVEDLANRTGLPTVNQIVVSQAGVAAWRAVRQENSSPLAGMLTRYDPRTRGASEELVKASHPSCTAASNMARVWNAAPDLRAAGTLSAAKQKAKQFAAKTRFY